jgi:uncharacterized membrane protein
VSGPEIGTAAPEGPVCPAPVPPFHPRAAIGRLLIALLVGVGTSLLLSQRFGWATRIVGGWDAAATMLLATIWFVILAVDPEETRCRAAAVDPGRTAVWIVVIVASASSLFAAAGLMRHARTLAPQGSTVLIVASLIAVITAWLLTHTGFTLRYAHLYYRDDLEGEGGLCFPGDRKPSDFDFSYFAFTVGMCFQVSDVTITSPQIRRAVLGHALLSFAYNTVILALALNLLFGILS